MEFFELSENSAFEKQWIYAALEHPRSQVFTWQCVSCGRAASYSSGSLNVTVENGSAFPDRLGTGFYPLFIVSEAVVRIFTVERIGGFRAFPVGIENILESDLKLKDAPSYYRLEVDGECKIDLVESGYIVENVCIRCGEVTLGRPPARRFEIIAGSWSGHDLFRDCRLFPRVIFCTRRLVEIISLHRFTNFRANPMGDLVI